MVNVGNLRDLVRSTIIEIVAENISHQLGREITSQDMEDLFFWYEEIRDNEESTGTIACFSDWPIFEISFSSYALDHIPTAESVIKDLKEEGYKVDNPINDYYINRSWVRFYEKFPIRENIYGIIEEARKRLCLEIISQRWRNLDEFTCDDDVCLLFKMGENYYKAVYSTDSEKGNYISAITPVLQVYPRKVEIEIFE